MLGPSRRPMQGFMRESPELLAANNSLGAVVLGQGQFAFYTGW